MKWDVDATICETKACDIIYAYLASQKGKGE
jgi:hypothetical protein